MPEPHECVGCCAWEYQNSDFREPEGKRITGYCRVWHKGTNQSYGCYQFSSKADQERQYYASVAKAEEAKGNIVLRDEDGKPVAVLDTSNL